MNNALAQSFEDFLRKRHPELSITSHPGAYEDPTTQALWEAWVAATAAATARQAQEARPPPH